MPCSYHSFIIGIGEGKFDSKHLTWSVKIRLLNTFCSSSKTKHSPAVKIHLFRAPHQNCIMKSRILCLLFLQHTCLPWIHHAGCFDSRNCRCWQGCFGGRTLQAPIVPGKCFPVGLASGGLSLVRSGWTKTHLSSERPVTDWWPVQNGLKLSVFSASLIVFPHSQACALSHLQTSPWAAFAGQST